MNHALRRTTFLPGDIAEVVGFFDSPRNLETITPPWLRFRVTSIATLFGRLPAAWR